MYTDYALAYSAISYYVLVWGRATNYERVLIAQKPIIRLIYSPGPLDSCRDYFKENGILTSVSVFIFRALLHVRKNLHLYVDDHHNYDIRYQFLLRLPKHRMAVF